MASKKPTPLKKTKSSHQKLPPNCGICNVKFGLFLGRHQCAKCKMILCANCSFRKHRKDPRVCVRCKPVEVPKGAAKSAAKTWKCTTCTFENELEHGACFACNSARPTGGAFHVGAKVNSTSRSTTKEAAIIKSENSDGTYNIVFESDYAIALHVPKDKLESVLKGQATLLLSDIASITAEIEATKKKIAEAAKAKEAKSPEKKAPTSWWCAFCTFENKAAAPKCVMCKQEKPAFSYPFWACGGCTLVNPLGAATCELCGTKKPAPGPRLVQAQEAAQNADALLVRDTQQTPVSPTQPPPKKKMGEATLLSEDIAQIQAQIEAAKKFLADTQAAKESKDKEAAAEQALAAVTESVAITIAESEEVASEAGMGEPAPLPSVTPVKKKKKGVTFGFSAEEPKAGSRLAYARAQTLAVKKSKGLGVGGGKGGKFAITVRSEWLEAEMNVKKMMTDWDDLNKKTLKALAEETKSEEKVSETVPETPPPTETPTPTPAPETPTSTTETPEEHADDDHKSDALFEKLAAEFKSITVEEKEKEKKEAEEAEKLASTTPTPTPTPSSPAPTPSSPTTETPSSPAPAEEKEVKDLTVEKELLLYLENNKDRYKAFSSHSQEYSQGKITAFMYYYLIGKTFGDGLVPIVLPLVLKALEGNPKKQEALKCYHQFAMSKSCGLCKKMVYLPEEIRAADKSWHRWCFKCQGDGCVVTLDLRSFFSKAGKIYCKKHLPS